MKRATPLVLAGCNTAHGAAELIETRTDAIGKATK